MQEGIGPLRPSADLLTAHPVITEAESAYHSRKGRPLGRREQWPTQATNQRNVCFPLFLRAIPDFLNTPRYPGSFV
jgi:hypothetical protein